MHMISKAFTLIGAGAVVLALLTSCIVPGKRLLRMEISQAQQVVLRTSFDAGDSEKPIDLWVHAGAEPFSSDEKVVRIQALENDPLRATLTGPVEIRIYHVDQLLTSASLNGLELRRSASGSIRWYLERAEVERAQQAAVLGELIR